MLSKLSQPKESMPSISNFSPIQRNATSFQLATVQSRLGDALVELAKYAEAEVAYQEGIELRKQKWNPSPSRSSSGAFFQTVESFMDAKQWEAAIEVIGNWRRHSVGQS